MKKCSKCLERKGLDEFYNKTSSPDGKMGVCKACRKAYDKKRYEEKKDDIQKSNRDRWRKNKERYKIAQSAWRERNRDRMNELDRQRYFRNREENMAKRREWYRKNREKILEEKKVYFQENKKSIAKKRWKAIKSCPTRRISDAVRKRTTLAFKNFGYRKNSITSEIIGCDWEKLKDHIESQFEEGMTWGNYGEWHVDHIVPLASASTEQEILSLCHYTNLQPLWAKDNLSKGGKMPEEWESYRQQ